MELRSISDFRNVESLVNMVRAILVEWQRQGLDCSGIEKR
jgi:hypothetical protein